MTSEANQAQEPSTAPRPTVVALMVGNAIDAMKDVSILTRANESEVLSAAFTLTARAVDTVLQIPDADVRPLRDALAEMLKQVDDAVLLRAMPVSSVGN